MASQPPWTLTPSCRGASRERTGWRTREARHFDTSRRSTSPMAMGRWPPFFLLARREAPQRCGVTVGVARPAARRLTNLVREARTRFAQSGEGQHTASRRSLGRSPDGPAAEPFGNDLTPLRTADSLRVSGGGTELEGRAGGAAWGCLFSISCRTSAEGVARPLEDKALMALLYWPSWTACFALLMW